MFPITPNDKGGRGFSEAIFILIDMMRLCKSVAMIKVRMNMRIVGSYKRSGAGTVCFSNLKPDSLSDTCFGLKIGSTLKFALMKRCPCVT